jgi:hypothetical protein
MRKAPTSLVPISVALALLAGAAVQAQTRTPAEERAPRVDVRAAGATRVAAFDGLWCGTGLLHEFSLQLTQQRQDVQGTLVRRDRVREIEGRVDGSVLRTQSTKVGSLVLERAGDELRITGGDGPIALARGATFQRAAGAAGTG